MHARITGSRVAALDVVMERRFNSMQSSVRMLNQNIEQIRVTNKPAEAEVSQIGEVAQAH
jgi:hypothetical protein